MISESLASWSQLKQKIFINVARYKVIVEQNNFSEVSVTLAARAVTRVFWACIRDLSIDNSALVMAVAG